MPHQGWIYLLRYRTKMDDRSIPPWLRDHEILQPGSSMVKDLDTTLRGIYILESGAFLGGETGHRDIAQRAERDLRPPGGDDAHSQAQGLSRDAPVTDPDDPRSPAQVPPNRRPVGVTSQVI